MMIRPFWQRLLCVFMLMSTRRFSVIAWTCAKRVITLHPNNVRSQSTPSVPRRQQVLLYSTSETIPKVPAKFVPFPFDYRQQVEIRIETLTNRGWGLGRYTLPSNTTSSTAADAESQKWVIMVPNVIPNEVVRVRIFRNFDNYSEADLVEILQPSEDRVIPVCPLAADCGGCQLQHMSIASQRRWKTHHVEEALQQYKLDDIPVNPCFGTDETYGYRSKITPHYPQPPRRSQTPVMITAVGFQKQTSRHILDVPHCPIATPAVNQEYQRIRETLLHQPTNRKRGATLLLRQGNLDDDHVTTDHKAILTTRVRDLDFSYRAGNFFQNNYYVLPHMVDLVVQEACRNDTMTHLADCYCGSGLFSISCASHFETVVGIEINDQAVAEATANAHANGITNCQFIAAQAQGIFDLLQDFPRDRTVVVLDPPRKGCSEAFLKQLYDFQPRRIVYMSCDPVTQARDAAGIVQAGYKIKLVQPFDLFPQTRHIECLMILEKKES